jgi:hypothetical protein
MSLFKKIARKVLSMLLERLGGRSGYGRGYGRGYDRGYDRGYGRGEGYGYPRARWSGPFGGRGYPVRRKGSGAAKAAYKALKYLNKRKGW